MCPIFADVLQSLYNHCSLLADLLYYHILDRLARNHTATVNGGQAIELARVHVKTDEETEGLGVSSARPPHAIRAIVERE